MLFRLRGLNLAEAPDDHGGNAGGGQDDATDKNASENKSDSKDGDQKKDSAQSGSDKADKKTADTGKKTDGADGDSDKVTDDDLTRASSKVANQYRKVNAENAGLKDKLASLEDVEAENARLKAESESLKEKTMKLELAGKYGVNPEMLEPIKGDYATVEKWLRNFVGETSNQTNKSMDSTQKDDKKADDKADEKKSDADKSADDKQKDSATKDKKATDIDGDRPAGTGSKDKIGANGLTTLEFRERARKNL